MPSVARYMNHLAFTSPKSVKSPSPLLSIWNRPEICPSLRNDPAAVMQLPKHTVPENVPVMPVADDSRTAVLPAAVNASPDLPKFTPAEPVKSKLPADDAEPETFACMNPRSIDAGLLDGKVNVNTPPDLSRSNVADASLTPN